MVMYLGSVTARTVRATDYQKNKSKLLLVEYCNTRKYSNEIKVLS